MTAPSTPTACRRCRRDLDPLDDDIERGLCEICDLRDGAVRGAGRDAAIRRSTELCEGGRTTRVPNAAGTVLTLASETLAEARVLLEAGYRHAVRHLILEAIGSLDVASEVLDQ